MKHIVLDINDEKEFTSSKAPMSHGMDPKPHKANSHLPPKVDQMNFESDSFAAPNGNLMLGLSPRGPLKVC